MINKMILKSALLILTGLYGTIILLGLDQSSFLALSLNLLGFLFLLAICRAAISREDLGEIGEAFNNFINKL